jgi:hypothetical protein
VSYDSRFTMYISGTSLFASCSHAAGNLLIRAACDRTLLCAELTHRKKDNAAPLIRGAAYAHRVFVPTRNHVACDSSRGQNCCSKGGNSMALRPLGERHERLKSGACRTGLRGTDSPPQSGNRGALAAGLVPINLRQDKASTVKPRHSTQGPPGSKLRFQSSTLLSPMTMQ